MNNDIAYTRGDLGKTDPVYGGVLTDVSQLPDGTEFYVCNGGWYGRMGTAEDGQKFVAISDRPWRDGAPDSKPRIHGIDRGSNILALTQIRRPLEWTVEYSDGDGPVLMGVLINANARLGIVRATDGGVSWKVLLNQYEIASLQINDSNSEAAWSEAKQQAVLILTSVLQNAQKGISDILGALWKL